MAKKIVDEVLKLSIVIDGNSAQDELYNLEKSTRGLKNENKDLLSEKRKLERQNKKDSSEYKNLTKAIRENNRTIKENQTRMDQLQKEIGLTALSMTQLRSKAKQLSIQLSNMVPGSAEYERIKLELKGVSNRLQELRGKAQGASLSLSKVADGFNRYAALGASVIATTTGIVISAQKMLDYNGKLSDSQADVMKTTGLTKKEVDELTKSLGTFKTRTARMELLKLAEEAGRLGITGVENLKGFVNVANQMKVALGDDLSEVQIREVGKMVEIYEVGALTGRDFEGAMLSLGSAINEVAASGSNNAGYLVDFLKRTGGISNQVKLSAADNIGYAATFDELGQSAEISGTMMNKIWIDMFKNTSEYAKIAQMEVGAFGDLLNKDANGAMIAFLRGLQNNADGFGVMVEKLKDVEVGGARGDAALAALVSGLDKLEARQLTSNIAMMEATSLTDEYNIKNENLAAQLDKIKKKVIGWYSSEGLMDWLVTSVAWFSKFIGATEDADGRIGRFKNGLVLTVKVFAVLLAAFMTNVAWQKLIFLWTNRNTQSTLIYNLAIKARAVAERASMIITQLYAGAVMLLTGNLRGAYQAFRVMTSAMATTPFGALLAIVSAVATAYLLFKDSVDQTTLSIKEMNKVRQETESKIKAERSQVDMLLSIARDENAAQEARISAVKELNRISPEYLGNLTLEEINTLKATAAIESYIEMLSKKIELESLDSSYQKSVERALEIEMTDDSDYNKWYDYLWNTGDGRIEKKAKERKDYALKEEEDLQTALLEKKKELLEKNPDLIGDPVVTNSSGTRTGTEDKKAEAAREKRIAALTKYNEERLKLERDLEDARLNLLDDGYQKEQAKEDENHKRKLQDLDLRMVSEAEIEKSLQASKNKKLSAEERAFYEQQANHWRTQNNHLSELKEREIENHLLRSSALVTKYTKTEFDTLEQKYQSEKTQREIAYQQELQQLGNNKEKRVALKKEFDKAEIEAEKEKLEALLALYNQMLSGAEINGIDFSLLSPEAEAKLEEDVAKLILALEKINAAKSGENNPEKEQSLNLGETDILGFSQKQWETFFSNIENGTIGIETMTMAVQSLSNIWAQYGQYVEAGEKARLKQYEDVSDKKQRRLKRQLDTGVINHDQYNRAVEVIEMEFERNKAQLEYKQAKRKRAMDIANVVSNTALSIMKAYADLGPIGGTVAAALIGSLGAIQMATIARQPLPAPGFEDGYYSDYVKREQDGKIFKSTFGGKTKSGVVTKPTHFLTGENGPEMIIDAKAFRQMNPDLRDSLIRELRGIKGFEKGYYNSDSMRVEIPGESSFSRTNRDTPNNQGFELLFPTLLRIEELLEQLSKEGVIAHISNKNMKDMKRLKEGIKAFERLKENNKV